MQEGVGADAIEREGEGGSTVIERGGTGRSI